MSKKSWVGTLAGVAALLVVQQATHAALITLNAVQDTYIIDRPSNAGQRDSTNNGTLLLNWNNNSSNSANGRRSDMIFQFNLSSVGAGSTIVGAHLEYYDTGNGGPNGVADQANPFATDTYMVMRNLTKSDADVVVLNSASNVALDKDGLHEENMTYNAYPAAVNTVISGSTRWTENPASSMNLSLAANNPTQQYSAAAAADATALALLNSANINQGYVVFLNWLPPASQYRTFGDKESGNPPRLVLDVVPEPGSIVLLALTGVGLVFTARRQAAR